MLEIEGKRMAEINLRIDGMHCGACVRRVTQALQAVPGGEVDTVQLGAARIRSKDATVTPQAFIDAVGKAGYSAFAEQASVSLHDELENRGL